MLHSAALLAAVLAAAAAPAIHVLPHAGRSTTTFHAAFTAPDAAGHQGVVDRRYEVDASGPSRRGCVGGVTTSARPSRAGERVRVALRPGRGHWCGGSYTGAITEFQGPYCQPGNVCPLFVTRVRTIGHFRFRVR